MSCRSRAVGWRGMVRGCRYPDAETCKNRCWGRGSAGGLSAHNTLTQVRDASKRWSWARFQGRQESSFVEMSRDRPLRKGSPRGKIKLEMSVLASLPLDRSLPFSTKRGR